MNRARFQPQLQIFVCANERAAASSLGSGCGDRGAVVFAEMKRSVLARGLASSVWVTETKCLGVCPQEGCAIALSHGGGVFERVTVNDARAFVSNLEGPRSC